MTLSDRENFIRNVKMQGPQWMPCYLRISGASWDQWRDEMDAVAAAHPLFFPGFQPGQRDWDTYDFGPANRAGEYYTDSWGCVWHTDINGIEGVVTESPLDDWSKLDGYVPPDPMTQLDRGPVNWEQVRMQMERAKAEGRLTTGHLAHGFLFLKLSYLRGFENLMIDMATDEPRLHTLIDMVVDYWRVIVEQYVNMGIDLMWFEEDLGSQTASIISPAMFRKWIRPGYEKLMQPCREAGIIVGQHSDGYIMELIDDLMISGVEIVNPQDLCNGIDALAAKFKGKICIRLDVDRQTVVPYGTPQQIHDLIEEEVMTLGSPEGGLELICGIYPPTPPENVDAVISAFEKFRTYWFSER